jgi:hypothetical protein
MLLRRLENKPKEKLVNEPNKKSWKSKSKKKVCLGLI